ncbi:OmpA family protein [Piscinibacter gummiphilus]|uniref:Peptidoglycan-associated lipoprotein n=1 Tax=Piscinibacter gummiphilus TaxID=946333 RepID=A0ABZ0CLU1_9BURK|nr:OmpA family protein [Piscinibacter gummiphilus]WOB05930.1 OmpA family protein [Piscinibacter gummiphilus]
MNKLVSVAAAGLVMVLAACSSTPTDKTSTTPTVPSGATAGAGKSGATDGTGQAASTVRSTALPAHLDPNSALSKEHSVFFGFDEAAIGPEDARVIEQHGKYLAAMPSLKVKIEGNADERGSAEYNLSLGQKRAEATLKALKIWGVRDSQMEPISWGEEHPQDKGHDESAYTHNRRADIVYAKP